MKTYAAEIDGLNDWIVGAPNQTAALEAFGVNQNLFAQGAARVETAPDAVKAATGHPGVPLRRRKGSSDPFAPVASNAASDWSAALDAAVKAPKGARRAKASPARPAPPSRRALDRAEAELADLENDKSTALDDLMEERRALEAREAELKARFKDRIAKAKARVKREAAAFRAAGG